MSSTALVPILNRRKLALSRADVQEINAIYARRDRMLKIMRSPTEKERTKTEAARLVHIFNIQLTDYGVNPHG